MASWYLLKLRYQKEDEAGSLKTLNEQYLIDSISFTEAEAIGYKKIVTGASDFSVTAINRMRLADLFAYKDGEKWFKAKVIYYSVDDKSGDEKKVVNYMLVNADGIDQALARITESLRTMLIPYETTDINLTQILDVIPYEHEKTDDEITDEIAEGVNCEKQPLREHLAIIKKRNQANINDIHLFASLGIPVYTYLSDVLNVEHEEVYFSAPFTYDMVRTALANMLVEGGIFYGLVEARNNSVFVQLPKLAVQLLEEMKKAGIPELMVCGVRFVADEVSDIEGPIKQFTDQAKEQFPKVVTQVIDSLKKGKERAEELMEGIWNTAKGSAGSDISTVPGQEIKGKWNSGITENDDDTVSIYPPDKE